MVVQEQSQNVTPLQPLKQLLCAGTVALIWAITTQILRQIELGKFYNLRTFTCVSTMSLIFLLITINLSSRSVVRPDL